MKRWLPRSLFGQMLLILLAGLLVSQLVGSFIAASDRAQAVQAIGGYAATQRIANLARLVDEAPPEWRSRIVAAAGDPTLRVSLSRQAPAFGDPAGDAGLPIRRFLAEQLPAALSQHLRVVTSAAAMPFDGFGYRMPMMGGRAMLGAPWMHDAAGWRGLQAAVQLSDGQWLVFSTTVPRSGPSTAWQSIVALGLMAIIVVLASIWAVGRVTAPLGIMARAAERLGRDVNAPPIAEAGTREMRRAAQSFNQMQARLRRLLDNRTRMLAALSHDLRTPLTLLRLRAENLPETDERERMLGTIGELDDMVAASLRFARDQAATEHARRTDLTALVTAIVDDMADAGLPVTLHPAEALVLECQPAALRRAITNLIDNAVHYGNAARVAIEPSASAVTIHIDDDGPGIPPEEQQRVFEPFHRLEPSRSRETGGTGLGLSIAQSIVQAHGGEITLHNRPEGGLRASLSLPR